MSKYKIRVIPQSNTEVIRSFYSSADAEMWIAYLLSIRCKFTVEYECYIVDPEDK